MHFVFPAGIDNPARPSGGNGYDRRMCTELASLGWRVVEHPVAGSWPHPAPGATAALGCLLAGLADGAPVLMDGLVALSVPGLAALAGHLPVAVLVHMLLSTGTHDGGSQAGLERAALRGAAAVVTTSAWTRRQIIARHGMAGDRIDVVEPGVDRAAAAPGTPTGGGLLCVAAVSAGKGHDVLADALAAIADLEWTCTCVGALDVDPAFTRALRRQLDRDGIGTRVNFPGPLAPAEVAARYAGADVLVLASRSESYGMVVAEALACGLPVIAAAVGGVPETLGSSAVCGNSGARAGHGDSGTVPGLLVPADNAPALAEALRLWLADPRLRAGLRAAALDRRDTLGSWAMAGRALSDVVQRLLPAGPKRGPTTAPRR